MAAVESIPVRAIMRDLCSGTRIQAAIQKKIYGIRVVMTAIVASSSKWLDASRRSPLATQLTTSATGGFPLTGQVHDARHSKAGR